MNRHLLSGGPGKTQKKRLFGLLLSRLDFLRRNIDFVLGIAAWALAVLSYYIPTHLYKEIGWTLAAVYLFPILCVILVVTAHKYRKRPHLHLLWVWPSLLVAFLHLAIVVFFVILYKIGGTYNSGILIDRFK